MLVDVPYAVAKTFQEGDWLLLPDDALVDYAGISSCGYGSRTDSMLMLLLSRSKYDGEGRLVVEFVPARLADELGCSVSVIYDRMGALREGGRARCLVRGANTPRMGQPRPSVWELLPDWTASVLSPATAGRDVLFFEDEDGGDDPEENEEVVGDGEL